MATAAKESTALVKRDDEPAGALRLLRPVANPSEIMAAQNETRAMVHQTLKEGRDFGKIPGTDKPTLLKPGAERVVGGFGCMFGEPIILEREIDHDREVKWSKRKKKWRNAHRGDREFTWEEEAGVSLGLYRYVVRVQIINRANGEVVGEGVGACSSMESKYIDRPRDSENTILKMAHKRAMVAATLVTFGLSDEFTQDVEDIRQNEGAGAQDSAAESNEPEDPYAGLDPETLTVEQALELPLYGAPDSWGKNGTKPLHMVPGKVLVAAQKWFQEKLQGDAKPDARPKMELMVAAIPLVIEALKKGPAEQQLPLEEKKAAPENPTALKPGNVEDAVERPKDGVVALTKRLGRLLEHKKLTKGQRDAVKAMMAEPESTKDMLEQIERIERDLKLDEEYGF